MKRFSTLLIAYTLGMGLFVPGSALAGLNDYFVGTDWLATNRDAVKVVDVRVAPLYLLGHIDEAVHIDKSEFLSTRSGVKSLVPTVAEFEALMNRYGITPDTTVVAYAEHDNPYAARFIWTLRYHGHEKSYVLDGGYEKWNSEDRAVAMLPTRATATSGYKCSNCQEIRTEGDYLLTRLNNPSVLIWDTRRTAEYEGTEIRADRGGHIPGAVHLEWVNLQKEVNGIKVLKSEEEIRALLKEHAITPASQVVAHCQTGIRSSYATLVLLGLGYDNARNYDGSWIEWANNRVFPVENVRVATR